MKKINYRKFILGLTCVLIIGIVGLILGLLNGLIFVSVNGSIDEVYIYNKTLTTDEISTLYNYTAPTYTIKTEEVSDFLLNESAKKNIIREIEI